MSQKSSFFFWEGPPYDAAEPDHFGTIDAFGP